jgi:hypothetical protein
MAHCLELWDVRLCLHSAPVLSNLLSSIAHPTFERPPHSLVTQISHISPTVCLALRSSHRFLQFPGRPMITRGANFLGFGVLSHACSRVRAASWPVRAVRSAIISGGSFLGNVILLSPWTNAKSLHRPISIGARPMAKESLLQTFYVL